MNEIVNIKNNSFFSFISITSRLIPNVLIFWILARYFGPTSFGKFSYSHTLANTFLLFADFGFDLLITTEIAKRRLEAMHIFQEYFWIKICLAFLSLIAMWLFIFIRGGDSEALWLGLVFSLYMLFNTITNFFVASFKGFERLDLDAKISISMNLVLLFLSYLLYSFYQNIIVVALSYVISRIIGVLYSLNILNEVIPNLSYKILLTNLTDNLRKAFLYGILILTSSFLFQLDTILLGIFKTDYDVGIYQAVKNLMLVPFIIPGVVFSALLPTLARKYKENFEDWISLNSILFKLVFWLNLPISIILFVYPGQIIELLYGVKNYSMAIPILKIFAVILFLRSTSDYVGVMLITSGRQKIHIYTSVFCIPISIIIGGNLISAFGAKGASWAYLMVISIISVVFFFSNYKKFFKNILDRRYILLVAVSVLAGFIVNYWFNNNVFLGVLIIILVFFLIIFIIFDKNERLLIFSFNAVMNFRRNGR